MASNHLLTNENFDIAIHDALEAVGTAAEIDRIFIYKNVLDPDSGKRKAIKVDEYIKSAIKAFVDTNEVDEIYYTDQADGWYMPLLNGKTIKGLAHEFRDDIRLVFENQMIKSMMIVPVIDPKMKYFWGVVAFADCSTEHVWTTAEETVLSMLAEDIGGAIRRQ